MTFTAVVLRTFSRSCEVYVVASAESHDHTSGGSGSGGGREHRRFTNDALFTLALAAPSPTTTQGGEEGAAQEERALRQVVIPEGSALQALAAAADRRKMRRLQLREMVSMSEGTVERERGWKRELIRTFLHPPLRAAARADIRSERRGMTFTTTP